MCLMFTPQEPSDTLLVLAPLQPDGGVARWQLTYVNSVGQTAAAKSPFGNGKTFEDEQVLMVVPFPNRGGLGEKDVILSAVFPHQVSKMRSSARAAFTPFTPEVPKAAPFGAARGVGGFGAASLDAPPLEVQAVGNYQISVAANLDELVTRAPWSRFSRAAGRVEAILSGMRQGYPEGFGFVIAQSDKPVKDAGFSVVYRDASPFVPTAHESTFADAATRLVRMDATILAFDTILLPHSIGTAAHLAPPGTAAHRSLAETYPTYRVDDTGFRELGGRWQGAADLLRALPVRGAGVFHRDKTVRHAKPSVLCQWKLAGGDYRNENVVGRPAQPSDVQALSELFAQLDDFLTRRITLGESRLVKGAPHEGEVPEMTVESAPSLAGGFSFGGGGGFGGGNTAGPFNHAEHARGVRARHGETVDVAVVLVGRQLAYPGIADRVSDAPPVGTPPPAATGAEMFLNLDAAGARGLQQAIDLDAPAFYGRKDAAELSSLADGTSLVGTVYVRLSATPAPHLMPIETRMVRGPPAAAAGAVHVGATARTAFAPAAPVS